MSSFAAKAILAVAVAALCPGAPAARAQAAPVQYWLPGSLFGFGGSTAPGSIDSYGNVPGFDAGAADWRDRIPNGMFLRSVTGDVGLSGLGQRSAFGSFGGLSYDSVVAGYNFKGAGGLPVSLYAGFDTLKYNPGFGGPLAPFSTGSDPVAGTVARAGIAIQATPNVSLSFDAGFAQQQSGRLDSDIRSPLLPGQTPLFIGGGR
jgi:hypothetical protein